MSTRIGINGFGRMGKQTLRAALERYPDKLEVVAVNSRRGHPEDIAHLFKYDSTYGRYPGEVRPTDDSVNIDGADVLVLNEDDPSNLPWGEIGVEVVIESTGAFNDAGRASGHLESGARKVIITAPAKGDALTVVLGSERGRLRPGATQHRQQLVMHHELHRADSEGSARQLRHRAWTDDDRPRLYQRPAHPGQVPLRSAQGQGRRPEHHPHDYGRGEVRRDRHARAGGEDQRHGSASAYPDRVSHRLRGYSRKERCRQKR